MKVHILGSAGWIPTPQSETTCIMVEHSDQLILLDAGTGISNLSNYFDVINSYNEVSIILSHYHLDHIIGLSYLIGYFKNHKINFYGPGKPFYNEGVEVVLKSFFDEKFFSRPIDKFSEEVKYHDYDEDGFSLKSVRVKVNLQKHSIFSFGINIDNILHLATDTSVISETFEYSKNSKLLLHECWEIEKEDNPKHSSLEEILQYKAPVSSCEVGLIHKNPFWSDTEYQKIRNSIEGKGIFIAEDGMTINIK